MLYDRCMERILVLQLPTMDLRYGHVVAASTDPQLIQFFCEAVLAKQEEQVKAAGDPFEREFQHIRLEQMRARLAWAAPESQS